MPEIKQRKNVFVSAVLAAQSSFNGDVFEPFNPDEVIVRSIAYYNNGLAQAVRVLLSTLVPDNVLGSFNESVQDSRKAQFTLQGPVGGTYQFVIVNGNGALLPTTGTINLHLEFVKY